MKILKLLFVSITSIALSCNGFDIFQSRHRHMFATRREPGHPLESIRIEQGSQIGIGSDDHVQKKDQAYIIKDMKATECFTRLTTSERKLVGFFNVDFSSPQENNRNGTITTQQSTWPTDYLPLEKIIRIFSHITRLVVSTSNIGGIRPISGDPFICLRDLRIILHNIKELDMNSLSELPNLSNLVVKKGPLVSVKVPEKYGVLPHLNVLDLSNNQLDHIPKELFSTLPRIRYVTLENNKILTVERLVFPVKKERQILNLSNNILTGFSPNALGRELQVFGECKVEESLVEIIIPRTLSSLHNSSVFDQYQKWGILFKTLQ